MTEETQRRSIPLPDPKALKRRKQGRPVPWALLRFLATILILVVVGWLAFSLGYVDRYAPQLRHGWSVLINDQDADHSEHGSVTYTCPMHPEILRDKPGECPICGMDLVPVEAKEPEPKEMDTPGHEGMAMPDSHPNAVSIDPQMLNSLGVRTEPVQVRSLAREVRFTGEIAVDDSSTEVLQSWVAGRLEKVYVDAVGDKIAKGDPIAKIYSPQLLTTSEELISAMEYAEELKRRKALPQSILDAEAMVQATEKRLRLWGLRPR